MTNRDFITENNTPQKRIKVLRALGVSEADPKSKEMNIWDKRKWLVLEDFWMGHITEAQATYKIAGIKGEEENDSSSRND